jgi:uncharacterized membrane protein YkoI
LLTTAVRKSAVTVAALGAFALGGSALADARDNTTSSTSSTATTPSQTRPAPPDRQPLSSDVAAKVKAAALKKVPGGTIERVETDVDHGSPYEAHVKKSDGTELEVLVNKDFAVTAVNTMRHP